MKDEAKPDWKALVPILRNVIFENRIFLTEHEQQVLEFIFQRTRMYLKAWEEIPLRHFTDGVWSQGSGRVCSRLRMKSNSVIAALKGLQGKGIIEVRDHPREAHAYRIVEPSEVVRHDVIAYIRQKQPKLMAAILLELRRNQRCLPPAYRRILHPEATNDHAGSIQAADSSDGRPQDTQVLSRGIAGDPSRGIDPTNKQIGRLKKPISNLALQRAKPCLSKPASQSSKLRIIPLSKVSEHRRNMQRVEAALVEASSWQESRRRYGSRRLDLLAVEKSWDEGMQAHWPEGYLKLSQRALRNLKLAVEQRGLPAEDLPPLLTWAITNWKSLRFSAFSFNPNKAFGPDVPDIQFFVMKLAAIYKRFLRAQELARPISQPAATRRPYAEARPFRVDSTKSEASRILLGLPKWDTN